MSAFPAASRWTIRSGVATSVDEPETSWSSTNGRIRSLIAGRAGGVSPPGGLLSVRRRTVAAVARSPRKATAAVRIERWKARHGIHLSVMEDWNFAEESGPSRGTSRATRTRATIDLTGVFDGKQSARRSLKSPSSTFLDDSQTCTRVRSIAERHDGGQDLAFPAEKPEAAEDHDLAVGRVEPEPPRAGGGRRDRHDLVDVLDAVTPTGVNPSDDATSRRSWSAAWNWPLCCEWTPTSVRTTAAGKVTSIMTQPPFASAGATATWICR